MSVAVKGDAMPTKRMRILADELNDLISSIEAREPSAEEPKSSDPTIDDWLEAALDAYNMRRQREKVFADLDLFGEPTWDILLDLFIGELKNLRMQTTSVCIGAQVPQTTGLRWIALLEKQNLVRRYRDTADSRRVYIQLTDYGLRGMVQIFYDRCFMMMGKRKYSPPKLSQLTPGTPEHDQAREALLSDAIAQIRLENPARPRDPLF